MDYQSLFIMLVAIIALTLTNVTCNKDSTNRPPLCEPDILEEMPPHIKKVCIALENSNQLSSALNAYIRNEAAGNFLFDTLLNDDDF